MYYLLFILFIPNLVESTHYIIHFLYLQPFILEVKLLFFYLV